MKPCASAVNGTFHPSGPKFLNVWKHFKLSPGANCDKWALCAVCQKGGETVWIPRSDGSTTRMKRHLIDVRNTYVVFNFIYTAHPLRHLCSSEEPKQIVSIDSKDAASQGHATRGTLSGFITKHFVPHFTAEEQKHVY